MPVYINTHGQHVKIKTTSMTQRIEATYSCKVNHDQKTGWQSGVRSCNILPGLPMHVVQKLNAGTVATGITGCEGIGDDVRRDETMCNSMLQ